MLRAGLALMGNGEILSGKFLQISRGSASSSAETTMQSKSRGKLFIIWIEFLWCWWVKVFHSFNSQMKSKWKQQLPYTNPECSASDEDKMILNYIIPKSDGNEINKNCYGKEEENRNQIKIEFFRKSYKRRLQNDQHIIFRINVINCNCNWIIQNI